MNDLDRPFKFTMTAEHLKLLSCFYIGWNDYAYAGSPGPGDKRPFGDSDVVRNIHEDLGWPMPDEDDPNWDEKYGDDKSWNDVWEPCEKRAMAIYRETEHAMAIVLQNLGEPIEHLLGDWVKPVYYRREWVKA